MKNNIFKDLDITKLNKDNLFKLFISNKSNKLCSIYLKWNYIKQNSIDLYNYLTTYFDNINPDTDSPTEILYRIINDIKEKPTCPICGSICLFDRFNKGYHMFCSYKCKLSEKGIKLISEKVVNKFILNYGETSPMKNELVKQKVFNTNIERYGYKSPLSNKDIQLKISNTNIEKYGYKTPLLNKDIQNLIKQTNILKYGYEYPFQSDYILSKYKETTKQKYGVECSFNSPIILELIKHTNLIKYNSEYYVNSDDMKKHQEHYRKNITSFDIEKQIQQRKQTCLEKYGVITNLLLPENILKANSYDAIKKSWETKKKNKTTNTSTVENKFYNYLTNLYGLDNIIKEYTQDNRYPYAVDFYIKTLDIFIEIQGHQSHGKHPYNNNNENDIKQLLIWLNKVSEKHPQYLIYINNWTIRDVKKRNTAIENNLNYLEIFTCKVENAIDALNKYILENKKYNVFIYNK